MYHLFCLLQNVINGLTYLWGTCERLCIDFTSFYDFSTRYLVGSVLFIILAFFFFSFFFAVFVSIVCLLHNAVHS